MTNVFPSYTSLANVKASFLSVASVFVLVQCLIPIVYFNNCLLFLQRPTFFVFNKRFLNMQMFKLR